MFMSDIIQEALIFVGKGIISINIIIITIIVNAIFKFLLQFI